MRRVAVGMAARVMSKVVGLVPRRRMQWAFGSREGLFVDNPRFLFEWMLINRPEICCRWISHSASEAAQLQSLGISALYSKTLAARLYLARSGVVVYAFDTDDVGYMWTNGAVNLNLYHGVPLKRIEFDTTVGESTRVYHPTTSLDRLRSRTLYAAKYAFHDVMWASSVAVGDLYRRSFGGRIRTVCCALAPRSFPVAHPDHEFLVPLGRKATDALQNLQSPPAHQRSTLLYAPTWRRGPSPLEEFASRLPELEAALAASGTVLLVKAHLYDAATLTDTDHVRLISSTEDVSLLLPRVDGVITDYSSVMFDAALAGLPILLWWPDLDDYVDSSSAGFNFDPAALVTRPAVRTFSQMVEAVADGSWATSRLTDEVFRSVWGDGRLDEFDESMEAIVDCALSQPKGRRRG